MYDDDAMDQKNCASYRNTNVSVSSYDTNLLGSQCLTWTQELIE